MSVGKSSHFLVHEETGQRYPIRAGVIIGRGSADIVFSKDTKLSNQHCEVMPAEGGLLVRDLHSGNGTFLNGDKLMADKPSLLTEEDELCVGEQTFYLKTVSLTKNLRRRRRQRPRARRSSFVESYSFVVLILIAAIGAFVWHKGGFTLDRGGEVALSQRQLIEILQNYQDMRLSLDRETAPPSELARRMQGQVLGRLSAMSRRWSEYQPGDGDRPLFNAELHLASAIAGHAKNQVAYINSGENKYLDEMDQWTDKIDQAVNEIHTSPAGQGFPGFMQSPLQLVEREMRQAFRDYRKLGDALEHHEISQRQMGERLRIFLMPKMSAVYSKMGAIVPQNDFEKRKVVLQQKLLTALLGQVKAMSLVAESGDTKYLGEMSHWTGEIEKINRELKKLTGAGRTPASGSGGPQ